MFQFDCPQATQLPTGSAGATGPAGPPGAAGAAGAAGASAYVYIAYATDNLGTGFITNPAAITAAHTWLAVLTSPVVIGVPAVGDFAGLWMQTQGGINTYKVTTTAGMPLTGLLTGDLCFVDKNRTWYRYNGAAWVKVNALTWSNIPPPPVTILGGASVVDPTKINFRYKLEGDTFFYHCTILDVVFDGVTVAFYIDLSTLFLVNPPQLNAFNIGYYQDVAGGVVYPITFATYTNGRLYFYFNQPAAPFPATVQGAFSVQGFCEVVV